MKTHIILAIITLCCATHNYTADDNHRRALATNLDFHSQRLRMDFRESHHSFLALLTEWEHLESQDPDESDAWDNSESDESDEAPLTINFQTVATLAQTNAAQWTGPQFRLFAQVHAQALAHSLPILREQAETKNKKFRCRMRAGACLATTLFAGFITTLAFTFNKAAEEGALR